MADYGAFKYSRERVTGGGKRDVFFEIMRVSQRAREIRDQYYNETGILMLESEALTMAMDELYPVE